MRQFTEDEVYAQLAKQGITHDLAAWLSQLDSRVFELEQELDRLRGAAKTRDKDEEQS